MSYARDCSKPTPGLKIKKKFSLSQNGIAAHKKIFKNRPPKNTFFPQKFIYGQSVTNKAHQKNLFGIFQSHMRCSGDVAG